MSLTKKELPALSTIKPDFVGIAQQLGAYLSLRPVWRDRLRSSTGQTIIEFIAAVGELDQYAIERLMQDAFPETAKLDSAIYAAMKTLGVRIKRKTPAVTVLPVRTSLDPVNGVQAGETYLRRKTAGISTVIPPYTQFTSPLGLVFNRQPIKFAAGSHYAYTPYIDESGQEEGHEIRLYEGRINRRNFGMNGYDAASIFSNEKKFTVSDTDIVVELNSGGESSSTKHVGIIPRQTQGLWNNINNARGWQDITTSDGGLHILFGTGIYGTIPTSGQLCTVRYAVTKGLNGNGIFPTKKLSCPTFPDLDTDFDCLVEVETNNSATVLSGGTNELQTHVYKNLGSQLYAAGQGTRAVTQQDYSAIIKNYAGIDDALIFGQDKIDSADLRYMNVSKIVTYPKSMSKAAFNELKDYLSKRSMFGMKFFREEDVFGNAVEPMIRRISLKANVYCDQTADLINLRDNYVVPAILTVIDREWTQINNVTTTASKINRKVAVSDLVTAIKNSNPAIDYVQIIDPPFDVFAKPAIENVTIDSVSLGNTLPPDTYFYALTIVTPYGESHPTTPLNMAVSAGGECATLTITVPPNYMDAYSDTSWQDIKVYRGTNLENMECLSTTLSDFTQQDNFGLVYTFTDDGTVPVLTGIKPPTKDSTKEWVVNLVDGWDIESNLLMFNTERYNRV